MNQQELNGLWSIFTAIEQNRIMESLLAKSPGSTAHFLQEEEIQRNEVSCPGNTCSR